MNHNYLKTFKGISKYSKKYSTYFDVYSKHLEKFQKPITFVEVGVFEGGSLEFWLKVLPKGSKVIGVEFNSEAMNIDLENIEIVIGDQGDSNFWDTFFNKFGKIDVLLDDGGHTNKQQIITVLSALPFMNNQGLILVEDTHFSYMREVGNPSKYSFINWAKFCVDSINERFVNRNSTDYIKQIENKIIQRIISVTFYESIVIFDIGDAELPTLIEAGSPNNLNFKQFRNINKLDLNKNVKEKIKSMFPKFIIVVLSKIINIFIIILYKFENRRLKKYFK